MPDMAEPPPAGSEFVGTWSGTAIQAAGTCSDGTTTTATSTPITLPISLSGGLLTWQAQCGATFSFSPGLLDYGHATQNGTATCPPVTQNGNQITQSFSQGTLSVNGNALTFSLHLTTSIAGPTVNGSCNAMDSGTLQKQ